jgi:hypothetical protein
MSTGTGGEGTVKAKSKWVESGGRARVAVTAAAALRQTPVQEAANTRLLQRARGAWVGLFVLMVTVWSTILISAIFSLRINKESCEFCPDGCTCSGGPPAYGY